MRVSLYELLQIGVLHTQENFKGIVFVFKFFSMSMFEHAKKNERVRNFDIEGDKKKWEMSIIIEIEEWKNKILEKEEGKK